MNPAIAGWLAAVGLFIVYLIITVIVSFVKKGDGEFKMLWGWGIGRDEQEPEPEPEPESEPEPGDDQTECVYTDDYVYADCNATCGPGKEIGTRTLVSGPDSCTDLIDERACKSNLRCLEIDNYELTDREFTVEFRADFPNISSLLNLEVHAALVSKPTADKPSPYEKLDVKHLELNNSDNKYTVVFDRFVYADDADDADDADGTDLFTEDRELIFAVIAVTKNENDEVERQITRRKVINYNIPYSETGSVREWEGMSASQQCEFDTDCVAGQGLECRSDVNGIYRCLTKA